MKKRIIVLGLLFSLCSIPGYAQIQLEENKTLTQKSQKEEYIQISNVGKYQAAVLAFSMLCKFPEENSKLILDSYFSKINNSSMSQSEKNDLNKEYSDEFKRIVDLNGNKSPEDLSCEKFKVEYDKIIKFVKEGEKK